MSSLPTACFHMAKKGNNDRKKACLTDLLFNMNGMANILMIKPLKYHQLLSGYKARPDEYPPARCNIPFRKLIKAHKPLKTSEPPIIKINAQAVSSITALFKLIVLVTKANKR